MDGLFLIGTAMAFFFELMLLRKRNKSISDVILAVWMFVIGLHLFAVYSSLNYNYLRSNFSMAILSPFPLLHGPFLFLYVMSLIRQRRKIRPWDYLHFIPYFLGVMMFLPLMKMTPDELTSYLNSLKNAGSLPWTNRLYGLCIQCSGLIYAIAAHVFLQRHRRVVQDRFSFEEQVSLGWLRYNIISIGIIYLVVIVSIALEEQFGLLQPGTREYFIFTAVTIFVFLFGYFGIRQESIFVDSEKPRKELDPLEFNPAERYRRSGLKPEQTEIYYQRLLNFMESEQPYLESRLTLQQLAADVDLSPNHLSQIINEKTGQNFYQFINNYRIEAFKEKLEDPSNEQFTILGIAMDCGFNSKSSFNQIFKKFTGITPSEYQQNLSSASNKA